MGDLASLAESIRQEGLLQPIGVTDRLELVFGERRLRSVRDILKRIADCRLRIADCPGNPQSAIHNPKSAFEKVGKMRLCLWEFVAWAGRE